MPRRAPAARPSRRPPLARLGPFSGTTPVPLPRRRRDHCSEDHDGNDDRTTNDATSPGACPTASSPRCICSAIRSSDVCGRTLPRATGSPQPPIPDRGHVPGVRRLRGLSPAACRAAYVCGRFAQPRSPEELARHLPRHGRCRDLPATASTSRPTDSVAAVVEHHGERVVDTFRWGLVPFFAEAPRLGSPLINARAETVETSPAFRASFARTALHRPRRGLLRMAPSSRPGDGPRRPLRAVRHSPPLG